MLKSMKYIVIYILIFSVFSFTNCKPSKTNTKIVSEQTFLKSVELEEFRKPTKELLNIRSFFVQDSFLLINNSRVDSLFMVFDVSSLKCIYSWGRKGRGPGEYGVFTHLLKINSNRFQVADFSRFNIQTYKIPELGLETEKKIINDRYEPQLKEIPQNIITPDGNLYFYDNLIRNELLITKWENGSTPIVITHFETFKSIYKSPFSYMGCLGLNTNKNKLVYGYNYLRRFDIMNLTGNVLKSINITPATSGPIENGNRLDIENSVICYKKVRAFKDSFFLLYIGYSGTNILEKKEPLTCYIEQFDWNGAPLKRYKINRFISNFDIVWNKEEVSYFIGIDDRDNHPLIFFKEKL